MNTKIKRNEKMKFPLTFVQAVIKLENSEIYSVAEIVFQYGNVKLMQAVSLLPSGEMVLMVRKWPGKKPLPLGIPKFLLELKSASIIAYKEHKSNSNGIRVFDISDDKLANLINEFRVSPDWSVQILYDPLADLHETQEKITHGMIHKMIAKIKPFELKQQELWQD